MRHARRAGGARGRGRVDTCGPHPSSCACLAGAPTTACSATAATQAPNTHRNRFSHCLGGGGGGGSRRFSIVDGARRRAHVAAPLPRRGLYRVRTAGGRGKRAAACQAAGRTGQQSGGHAASHQPFYPLFPPLDTRRRPSCPRPHVVVGPLHIRPHQALGSIGAGRHEPGAQHCLGRETGGEAGRGQPGSQRQQRCARSLPAPEGWEAHCGRNRLSPRTLPMLHHSTRPHTLNSAPT